jgi:hypothetical protein
MRLDDECAKSVFSSRDDLKCVRQVVHCAGTSLQPPADHAARTIEDPHYKPEFASRSQSAHIALQETAQK